MTKKTKPFITEMQVEGSTLERKAERADTRRLAHELITDMPPKGAARQAYVRNLVVRALKKEIDPVVFEEFVSLTNIQPEVDAVLARSRAIAERTRI